MYQSKKMAPGGSIVYASGSDDAIDRLSFTTRLRRAVEQKHWVLHWQPVVDLADGSAKGVEARSAGGIRTAGSSRPASSSRSPKSWG